MANASNLDRDALERLVDTRSLLAVTEALADIAREKAEHIRGNWQDESLARIWEQAANALDRAAHSTAVGIVSR